MFPSTIIEDFRISKAIHSENLSCFLKKLINTINNLLMEHEISVEYDKLPSEKSQLNKGIIMVLMNTGMYK